MIVIRRKLYLRDPNPSTMEAQVLLYQEDRLNLGYSRVYHRLCDIEETSWMQPIAH